MKKLILILIVLFMFYIGLQMGFKIFGKGHSVDYKVKTNDLTFNVHEDYYQRIKNEKAHYEFSIKTQNNTFYFTIYDNFKRNDLIIKDIYYYSDKEYECILPLFIKNIVVTDMMCMIDNITYNYNTIKGTDNALDNYIKSLNIYDSNKFIDDKDISISKENIKVYQNNFDTNQYVLVNNYKGAYIFNNNLDEVYNISLFNNDIYKQTILGVVGSKYVVANYNEEYDFNSIYVVDLKTLSKQQIKTPEISFDSYIEGIIDNSIYLIDRNNKLQYQINLKNKEVNIIGNEKKGIKYYDKNKFINKEIISSINDELKFNMDTYLVDKDYFDRVEVAGDNSGFYYYYKKVFDGFDVYRALKQSKDNLTYLFHVKEFKQVTYIDDAIYLIDGNDLIYYQDKIGKRTLLTNLEFEFNDNLYYFIYNN